MPPLSAIVTGRTRTTVTVPAISSHSASKPRQVFGEVGWAAQQAKTAQQRKSKDLASLNVHEARHHRTEIAGVLAGKHRDSKAVPHGAVPIRPHKGMVWQPAAPHANATPCAFRTALFKGFDHSVLQREKAVF
ncbi:hypothetical protein CBM2586_P280001 [Cupriavidus phytorum]|uniref:Uncharacterized protein n=2 Tax=Cupriavidus TaxID=106589 RepID=A0A375F7S1_9BURK|nr:hypothetical protein CBM2585_P270001 [Cupriavidus taiwanensis]SOZ40546.1 hypothetical protein CBM2605_P270001 [Cupriavidus neocaledonicus]SOY76000.1 hypothetical protein CBM2589_P280001 [Cupriavidus taiwanensis]SOY77850.1 hypothetical protein CBM2586_P280001 [Cupriavidus taiwanensis]SOZ02338.1 hypothetical protein CBM2600_P290001 [Cupriavidus taiwanensis]